MILSKNNQFTLIAYNLGYRIIDNIGAVDPNGKKLKFYYKKGYPFFWYSIKGIGQKLIAFHRLAAYQKFGNLIFQKGIEVRHLNGDRSDFSSSNLEIGSAKDNRMDIPAKIRKIHAKSAQLKNRKLSIGQVQKIRFEFSNTLEMKTVFYKRLSKIYNVSEATISNVARNICYNT